MVYLRRYGVYALARYEQVHAALTDWQGFQSRAGGGLSNFRDKKPWRTPSLLLEADPPSATRRVRCSGLAAGRGHGPQRTGRAQGQHGVGLKPLPGMGIEGECGRRGFRRGTGTTSTGGDPA